MNEELLKKIPVKDKQILFRKEGTKTILLDNRSGQPFVMDETASQIWNNINGLNKVSDIVKLIKKEFAGEPDRIQKDIIVAIKKMQKHDFIFFKH